MNQGRVELVIAVQAHLKRNLGPLIRCATVFGASLLVVVGSRRFGTHGAHGSECRLRIVHFFSWAEAKAFLTSRCPKCMFFAICEKALPDGKSVKLEECHFTPIDSVFGADENGMVTWCVGPHKADFTPDSLSVMGATAVHIEFPVPNVIDRLRFENMFSIALDYYVSKIVSKSAGKAFISVDFQAEKYTVSGNLKQTVVPTDLREQVAMIKSSRALPSDVEDLDLSGMFGV